MARLSEQMVAEIIRLRREEGLNTARIAERLGLGSSTCSRYLIPVFGRERGSGTGLLRATVDATRFAAMDTEEEAYWLGFLFTDGCLTDKGGVSVTLAQRDIGHLHKYAKFLGSPRPPRLLKGKRFDEEHPATAVFFCQSLVLAGNLRRVGLHPRKTWTIEPWDGPPILMRHFWRGCVDGDGSLHVQRQHGRKGRITPTWHLSFCGNESMVFGFAAFVGGQLGFVAKPSREKVARGGQVHWSVRYVGRTAWAVAELLYKDASIFLDRKQAIAADLIVALDAHRAMPRLTTCTTPGCGRPFWAKRMCNTCYVRSRAARLRTGSQQLATV